MLAIITILLMSLTGCSPSDVSSITAQAAYQEETDQGRSESGELTVTYLDVGQGNALLAESEGHYMFIDGGARESSSFVVSYLEKQKIEKLDYLLISHFDEDHLAGAVGVLHNFPVETLITPDYETDSSIYNSYQEIVTEKGYEAVHPEINQEFTLGSAEFRIISPVFYGHEDENQDSVGMILQNGSDKFFIGGDIGTEGEKEIFEAGIDIQADVMLMNHHGSHVSEKFFQQVSPSYSVISCGEGNSYGHPRGDTTAMLEEAQIPLFRTDKQGTIIAHSNGAGITFEQNPCNDYTPGNRSGSTNDREENTENFNNSNAQDCDYVLNAHTKKIHKPDCGSVKSMDEDNKAYYTGDKQELLDNGYTGCGNCKP